MSNDELENLAVHLDALGYQLRDSMMRLVTLQKLVAKAVGKSQPIEDYDFPKPEGA